MDYSQLPNPYDFANPVNVPSLFAGRKSQLDEIKYYLDHVKTAARAINIAIIGSRASGKTSILNMIEHEAKKREFRVVRADLDESDGQSQLAFFYKLFDSIITTNCIEGELGGIHGDVYNTFRTIVDTYDTSLNTEKFPFIFPIQYGKAMKAGNPNIPISDTAFKHDIAYIKENIQRPIIIVMDECNVLVKSRIHFEKLRNIFMNTQGFMLVLTGTEALFPLIDEVFSPIIRQFKKISIGPFDKVEETRECVRRPLQNLDVDPFDVLDTETYFDISAIHDLSSGRPYEIQLLCHLLFRRVQQGRSEKMTLTSDILDEVLNELQASKVISLRPTITKIRSLEKEQLAALGVLCLSDGLATFDQVWFSEYLANGNDYWSKESLVDNMVYLKKIGLIDTDENGTIKFKGDDFDRIYCKYYSRKQEIYTTIGDTPPSNLLGYFLASLLNSCYEDLDVVEQDDFDNADILSIIPLFHMEDTEKIKSIKNPFDANPELAKILYTLNLKFADNISYPIGAITVTTSWCKVTRLYTFDEDSQIEEGQKAVTELVERIRERAIELGGNVENSVYIVQTLNLKSMTDKVSSSKNEEIKREIFDYHVSEMFDCYLETGNKELALVHAETALLCSEPSDGSEANNLGYVLMSGNNLEASKNAFIKSISLSEKDGGNYALPHYNLSILRARENNIFESINLLMIAREKAEKMSEVGLACSCLFVPLIDNGNLIFKEVSQPNLLDTINEAMAVLNDISKSQ